MTRTILLERLRDETELAIKNLKLPVVQQQSDNVKPSDRSPSVYLMRLPERKATEKKAPFILHQIVTGKDWQPSGERARSTAVVRSVFCVYHKNDQEGALSLLALMEKLRIHIMEKCVIGEQFQLLLEDGLDFIIYPDNEDTPSYFLGEMISSWVLPRVERKVDFNGSKY